MEAALKLNEYKLKSYNSKHFTSLSDFHIARHDLELYQQDITTLGTIICKYGFEDVVGINLLHKHFDISDNELIIRRFENENIAYMRPEKKQKLKSNIIPYLWAYNPDGWYPIEFIEWNSDTPCPDFVLLSHAHGFLLEFSQKLTELNLEHIFGLAGLYARSPFHLKQNNTLLETTDEENKTLTLKIVPEEDIISSDTTQTLWIFSQCHTSPPETV